MEHIRFVGLDIHKERISIAVAESGRGGLVEYLGEIANDPDAITSYAIVWGVPARRWRFAMRPARAVKAFIANSMAGPSPAAGRGTGTQPAPGMEPAPGG
ncbi:MULTISPECIES: hypothetical protein [Mesorhizobium]|uniref:hypothetical protein n=1 Tax=Mesorhizobium TaxID=68287 RepID=UPI0010103282|nr:MULTISPECIES: hypothetical protein [Mesorhizobium]